MKKTLNPVVEIKTSLGDILVELYPDIAKNTVNNFIYLVEKGFYDTLIFHRVIPGFMIQGGDPTGTGMAGPGYCIKGEFLANGVENNLKHKQGVISMARAMDYNSAGSQFFIMDEDAPHLDGQYAAFGRVIKGMDVVHKIAYIDRDANDRPLTPVFIEEMFVYSGIYNYDEPEKLPEI
ncbi:MAG: peptidylprolyl isomerase [Clostridia bacterium]|nr:peptidylprolyl isomerase [Clostridia bacterium]